jgi:hypothetical protein
MNAKTSRFSYTLLLTMSLLLSTAPVVQACFLPWQPTSVRYEPPTGPGAMATLVLGPEVCVLFFDPHDPTPPVLTVVGSDITLSTNLLDVTGVGVPPGLHAVVIPIPALAPGEYRLLTRLTASQSPIPDANLPLSVSAGTVAAIPISRSWLLIGIGIAVLLTAWHRLKRKALMATS